MKKILSIILSLLMVFSAIPFTMMSAAAEGETAAYQTIIDMSNYNGATINGYASPWYTKGLTRSYNISSTGYSYDATLDALKLTRGTYDSCGLYYFDDSLPTKFSDSLGFRVWVKGDKDSGADVTSNTNIYYIFDTVDGETHTAYAAAWYENSSYKHTISADGGWLEFYWSDMDKNFRKNGALTADRPTLSVGSAAAVASSNWLDKVDGFVIGFKEVGAGKIYYVGDVQLIKPAVTVTVDGQNITSISGEKITLPEPTTDGVIGYSDGKTLYYPGSEYVVPGNITLTNITKVIDSSSDHDFVFDTSDKTYTGSEICPAVTSATLTQGVDYTVEYKDNVNVGTGTICVHGAGSCYINLVENFNITRKEFEESDFTLDADGLVYTGEELKPAVSSEIFTAEDYEVYYENNVKAGTATVRIYSTNLNGSGSVSLNFTIAQKEIDESMFTIDTSNKVFTDKEIRPDVTSDTLEYSNDFSVGYSKNIDVGTAKIIIEGIENYTGTIEKTFEIVPKEITEEDFTVDVEDKVYTGDEIKPDVTSTLADDNYTVEYSNNVNTGTATVTVKGIGNYAGELTYNFNITQKEIEEEDFNIDLADKDYTGQEIRPSVTSDVLQDGDYEVAYKDNKDAGEATITIKGIGNCTGEIVKTFTINKKTLTKEDFTVDLDDKEYSNQEIKPEITSTFVQDVDYTVEYANNVNVGTAKIKISACGDNCEGTVEFEFEIIAHELEITDFTLETTEYEFDNCAYTPAVSSSLKDSDYTVAYAENVNAGEATVAITGKGNCSGVVTLNFTITQKPIEKDWFSLEKDSETYTGSEIEVGVVSDLEKAVDYTVSYENNVKVGKATVTVEGIGNYKGTQEYTFEITRKSIEKDWFKVDTDSKVFVNGEIRPDVTSDVLTKNIDYIVSYSNNTNVGTATVTITGLANYEGEVTFDFEITPDTLTPDKFEVDNSAVVYTGAQQVKTVKTDFVYEQDYTVAYENNVNVGTATVVITGIGNYTGTVKVDFEITPKAITEGMFSVNTKSVEYTGKAQNKNIVTGLVLGTDYKVTYTNNVKVGTATITIEGIGNYNGKIVKAFKITKPKVNNVKKVTVTAGKKKATVKWKKVTGANGYVIQYSLKKNFKGKKTVYVKKKSAVKKVITKLKSNKKYYVRVAAYKNYKKTGSNKTLKAIGKYTKCKKATTIK